MIPGYFLCATPRSGSTLLCALLKSTGVAGVPESYFRQQDLARWAARWRIEAPTEGISQAYADAAMKAGRTSNEVYGVRVMWGTLDQMIEGLKRESAVSVSTDREILEAAFGGPVRYVYLVRDDTVAQAVSLVIAEQTQVWHQTSAEPASPRVDPVYDFAQVDQCVREIEAHNKAWSAWFHNNDITPLRVSYSEIEARPQEVVHAVLAFLGLSIPEALVVSAPNIRLANEVNEAWIARYIGESDRIG